MDHGPIEHAHGVPYLREIVVFLLAAVLVIPIVQRLKASPIIGYLVIGAAIGPFGLALIDDVEGVHRISDLGIVFLLFTIGLELSLERLRALARLVFGLGALQVVVSAAVIGLIAFMWGNSMEVALVLGACLALSSTAMVMQILIERGQMSSPSGRAAFAVLLFQDLAVVPILLLVNVFTGSGEGGVWLGLGVALGKAAAAVIAILIVGRLGFRPLFRIVAWTRSPELFMAMTLLAILSIAMATEAAGLSMALGAFLAGLMLAETEYRHQVETDILPFKGLLLSLFFISVGMQIDFGAFLGNAGWIVASVLGLIAIKGVLLVGISLAFGKSLPDAVRIGASLAAAGEFGFIVIAAAGSGGLMEPDIAQFMTIVVALSMAMTPFLPYLGEAGAKLATRLVGGGEETEAPPTLAEEGAELEGHVIIAGYGRVGRFAAEILKRQKTPILALDLNGPRIRACRAAGEPVYFGDASRLDVLERAGAERAAAILVTLDHPQTASRLVAGAHERWPNVPIFARSRDDAHTEQLRKLGARRVVPEAFESSLQLSGQLLQDLGYPVDAVTQLVEQTRLDQYEGAGAQQRSA